jgi:hypothetical protein
MGGLDAYQKKESAKFTGSAVYQGTEFPLLIIVKNGKAMRMNVEVNGSSILKIISF